MVAIEIRHLITSPLTTTTERRLEPKTASRHDSFDSFDSFGHLRESEFVGTPRSGMG
ncbi:hypothetical protein AKJ09_00689 [Labilithrix luteola]|uniref:Uncharacterized protein n=1 Tax=Labilithrix luteola TaxID=1391654 RepID=A0A0K1PKH1_9BACT|nr:hypothetical protein AKJ09_00689 [Labilithrix luteola]